MKASDKDWKEERNCFGEMTLIKGATPERRCWVGAPEVFALDHIAHFLHQAFGEVPYLVGSATHKRDFRDVDIRMVFDDGKFEKLFGTHHGQRSEFWSLLCVSVSEYVSKRIGLKVDFQIQKRSAVTDADWDKVRSPLGLFYTDGEPDWKKGKNES